MNVDRPAIAPGSEVALIAPSGPAPAEQVLRAVGLVESWGLRPVLLPGTGGRHGRASYLADRDEQRAADLVRAWTDPRFAAVFCIRGGYGAVRILDLLDVSRMRAAGWKPLLGSSDVTAVHEWFGEQLGVPTWFTPMLATRALLDDEVARAQLRSAVLEGGVTRWSGADAVTLVEGEATGRLIGGNLSLLAMTIGARTRPPLDHHGCLALLEDVHEETYRIDGYLQTLLRAGWFDGVTGVALGSWQDCGPVAEIHELVLEALGERGIPIVGELGFGHGPGAASIPLGVEARLVADARPRLSRLSRGVPSRGGETVGTLSDISDLSIQEAI